MPDEEVALSIGGKQWRFWGDLEITRSIDTHSTAGFTAPFDVEHKAFREAFRPFSYQPVEVKVGGAALFTGTLMDVQPKFEANQRSVQVSCYSKAAILEDCNIPASRTPFEASGLSLRQVAERLAAPFGVGVKLLVPDPPKFKRVNTRARTFDTKLESDQKIQDFLGDLARQRELLISDTELGELLFWKATSGGSPVVRLEEGKPPLVSVSPKLVAQQYFNEVTGFRFAKRGSKGNKYTQRLGGDVLRSMSFRIDDIEKGDVPTAVRAHVGRMIAAAASYSVTVPTWRDPRGRLWAPNTTLVLRAPSAFVYQDCELLIREVTLHHDSDGTTASLTLVLPGAFSGELPTRRPWEE